MDLDTGFLTLLMNFVAPFVLGAAIAYFVLRGRTTSRRQRAHTEKATKELFERTDEQRARQPEIDG